MLNKARGRRSGLAAAGLLLGASLGVPALATATTPPPTLTNEFLTAFPAFDPESTVDIVADCDPAGTSTISWSVSGIATALFGTAPYPGTFIETGTATIGPATAPWFVNGLQHGYLLTVEAYFAIDSPVGQVIGSKRLTGTTDIGACWDLDNHALPDGTIADGIFRRLIAQNMRYDAVIITGSDAYLDSGTTGLTLEQYEGTGMAEIAVVQEAFTSTQAQVVPAPGGRATGGGRVDDVTFGFTAIRDKSGPKGRCAVVDATADVMVRCLDVTTVAVIGNRATIFGNATYNDAPVRYRMDVVDLDESGAGSDTWTFSLSNGYATGGVLTEGNVQVKS